MARTRSASRRASPTAPRPLGGGAHLPAAQRRLISAASSSRRACGWTRRSSLRTSRATDPDTRRAPGLLLRRRCRIVRRPTPRYLWVKSFSDCALCKICADGDVEGAEAAAAEAAAAAEEEAEEEGWLRQELAAVAVQRRARGNADRSRFREERSARSDTKTHRGFWCPS